jgi:hypothetical protein
VRIKNDGHFHWTQTDLRKEQQVKNVIPKL